MEPQKALDILNQAVANIPCTRQDHQILVEAIKILQNCIGKDKE